MNGYSKCVDSPNVFPTEDNRKYSSVSSLEEYQKMYDKSIESPKEFWSEIAEQFYWKTEATDKFFEYNFDQSKGRVFIEWLSGAQTNICYNVLDRNINNGLGDTIAYHWESNDSKTRREITYSELHSMVCRLANALKGLDVGKGDRIAIYMPVIIELVVAMLACARIGAVHCVVFAGLSSSALADRMLIANCQLLITVDGAYRCDKYLDFKGICNKAIDLCAKGNLKVRNLLVKRHCSDYIDFLNKNIPFEWNSGRDLWLDDLMDCASEYCEPVWVDSEDPLLVLCTSGSTGKPKTILHTTGGFMIWTHLQNKIQLNSRPGAVLFSTADLGWMIGHCNSVYGSLSTGATGVLMEGTPLYPSLDRVWKIVERFKVETLLTAPTYIRMLMKADDSWLKYDRSSLRVLAFGGEPINPDAWLWYWRVVGQETCTLVNLYGQTEAGGALISNIPGCMTMKPGYTGLPFFGVVPGVVDAEGNELEGEAVGCLVLKTSWPGIARTIQSAHHLFVSTYFERFPGYYCTGDAVRRDNEGYYWIFNRIDDMLKISGHLLSTLEVENSILDHKAVAEACVVSAPDPIKGHSIHVYVVLNNNFKFTLDLDKSIKQMVRSKIGALAQPDLIHPISALPRNRAGKLMRRVLFRVCRNNYDFGDISTMSEESMSVLQELKEIRH